MLNTSHRSYLAPHVSVSFSKPSQASFTPTTNPTVDPTIDPINLATMVSPAATPNKKPLDARQCPSTKPGVTALVLRRSNPPNHTHQSEKTQSYRSAKRADELLRGRGVLSSCWACVPKGVVWFVFTVLQSAVMPITPMRNSREGMSPVSRIVRLYIIRAVYPKTPSWCFGDF